MKIFSGVQDYKILLIIALCKVLHRGNGSTFLNSSTKKVKQNTEQKF